MAGVEVHMLPPRRDISQKLINGGVATWIVACSCRSDNKKYKEATTDKNVRPSIVTQLFLAFLPANLETNA